MSTGEELRTTSTKILINLPNLEKCHRQNEDGVTAKVTTREACASKKALFVSNATLMPHRLLLPMILTLMLHY